MKKVPRWVERSTRNPRLAVNRQSAPRNMGEQEIDVKYKNQPISFNILKYNIRTMSTEGHLEELKRD